MRVSGLGTLEIRDGAWTEILGVKAGKKKKTMKEEGTKWWDSSKGSTIIIIIIIIIMEVSGFRPRRAFCEATEIESHVCLNYSDLWFSYFNLGNVSKHFFPNSSFWLLFRKRNLLFWNGKLMSWWSEVDTSHIVIRIFGINLLLSG